MNEGREWRGREDLVELGRVQQNRVEEREREGERGGREREKEREKMCCRQHKYNMNSPC